MDAILERSHALKQAVVDFVLDAEGDLAQALETYAAGKLRSGNGNSTQQDLVIDSFITEGKVSDKSPLELFIDSHPDLPQSDRNLISSWHHSFMGLFAITKILADGFELRNWLTDKYYIVKPNNAQILQETSRFKEGEILLTRISPVTDSYWTFFSNYTIMGKLGKPKLAVAIGNFKEEYKNHLYSDAPDLLAEAWQSVVQYHQQFVDFFGKDEITLPGYQLNKKIAEFQELITEKYLAATGIDTSKPLNELVKEAGINEEEIKAAVKEMGADANVASEIFKNNGSSKMVMPKVDLPAELKKAEQVTAISHPRWGQMFLPTYSKVKTILSTADWQNIEGAQKLIRFYLEDKSINAFIWYRLAQEYPHTLENVLQTVLQRGDFQLSRDLDALLQEFNKPLEPDLPEIASVPVHLHNLFQAALGEVQKSKPQGKVQKKVAKGFK
ncbi:MULTISPECIES: hypothetical protein [Calothrix]|uniref:Uncharacterized protein n=2 Tax=Calothrix TaxID=1186 RepID=A0ABR8A664_9CYAN|nr:MULTISPECIES: hypothetical protein [Calothrix]MBD2195421.1 hypothetical protein [Calothrix parietina FACHB-288]MBD2224020.1 hypothetical protein [Calothrix anomala FACHB-343]